VEGKCGELDPVAQAFVFSLDLCSINWKLSCRAGGIQGSGWSSLAQGCGPMLTSDVALAVFGLPYVQYH
jgi:hypothetical protein